jgi:hypothetical protein
MSVAYVTVVAALLRFEAFIRKAFPFEQNLTRFWCIFVSIGGKGPQGGGGIVGLFYFLNTLSLYV